MKSDRNKEATTEAVASFCHCMRINFPAMIRS